jgi:hypothetical protein
MYLCGMTVKLLKILPLHVSLCLMAFFVSGLQVKAQVTYTAADIALDSAVHHYNALKDYTETLSPESLTDAQIQYVERTAATIVAEFDAIVTLQVQPQSEVARYFSAMTNYERGFVLGMKGNNAAAYSTLFIITPYMETLSASSFPKRYLYEGKNYVITWDNFAPTLQEFYTGMAEITTNLSKFNEVIPFAKKAMSLTYTNEATAGRWYRYIAASKFMEASKKNNYFPDDAFEVALNFLQWLSEMSAEQKKTISDYAYPTQVTAYDYLVRLETGNVALHTGYNWSRAAYAMQKLNDLPKTSSCLHKAADLKYTDQYFLTTTYAFAKQNNDNALGLKACALEEPGIGSGECDRWRTIADNWQYFGNEEKSAEASDKARSCEQLQEEAQKAYEKEQKKQERREHVDFSMYAGFYPLPLMTIQTNYWDYGAVFGIGMFNTQIEASYKIINRNKVMYDDLFWQEQDVPEQQVFWDGYRAHIAFKFGDRDAYSDGFYVGPLFEIVQRNMTSIRSTVTNETTGQYLGEFNFAPSEKAYNVMLNYGVHVEENHLMADMFFGIGATYAEFSTGDQGFTSIDYLFSDPLLEFRKETRFGPIVRMGLTVGLSTRD